MSRAMNRKNRRLVLETLQARELMAVDFASLAQPGALPTYSVDGTGNNLANVEWGSTNERLLRLAKAEYSDGAKSPAGADRDSPRVISNALASQSEDIISDRDLSAFIYAWGQFLDHDLGLTPSTTSESMLIAVPKGDPSFDPNGTGTQFINAKRSVFDVATGTSALNPREQINTLTSWIDGSMIYGTDKRVSDALRSFVGGKMKIANNGLLPLNTAANFPAGTVPITNTRQHATDQEMFAAGDTRANENPGLLSLQTLFVREHNRWADRIRASNPRLSDEELYSRARSIVIAEVQSITFNEWLPSLLGGDMSRYAGYDSKVNPGLSNEFSTAAFRLGHSMLGDDIEFLNNDGRPVAEGISLSEAFFNPAILNGKSIDSVFKYLASDPSSEIDLKVVDGVRNFLFGTPGSGGFDLASLNIQRGRDHGLADYNDVRAAIGMPKVRTFADISRNRETQTKLQQIYKSVDNIDLWVGLLAEDHLPNSSVGPTLNKLIRDQFERIRSGDRFWYERNFQGELLREIRTTKLSVIMKRNTQLSNVQSNVFVFRSSIEGFVFADNNRDMRRQPGENWLGNWTVELVDSASNVVGTRRTGPDGLYRFDVQNGLRTDQYTIRVTKDPAGRVLPRPITRTASITRGDQSLRGIDLGVPPTNTNALGAPTLARSEVAAPLPVDAASVDQAISMMEQELRRRRS